MEKSSTPLLVVAAALTDGDGHILMQKRRRDSVHGGLWEFPGGKVEPGETPESALLREIREELGIGLDADSLRPVTFASGLTHPAQAQRPLVILLYTCSRWEGTPLCHEGEAIAWFATDALAGLDMPPLDYPLARALENLTRAKCI